MTVDQLVEKLREFQSTGAGEYEVRFNDTVYGFTNITVVFVNPEHGNETFLQFS